MTVSKVRILAVGTLSFDLIATTSMPPQSDVLTIPVKDAKWSNGGRGGNFSIFSRALGADVDLVASVGVDFRSSDYSSELEARGIGVENLYLNQFHETPRVFVFAHADDSRVYAYRDRTERSEHAFQAWAATVAANKGYDVIYCTSEVPAVNRSALEASGSRLKFFSPAHDLDLYDEQCLYSCINFADIVIANSAETKRISSVLPLDSLRHQLIAFVETLGAQGSVVHSRYGEFKIMPCSPRRILDTTGAGDAYAAGMVVDMAATNDILHAARMGSAAASFAVEEVGCQTNIPSDKELAKRFLKAYNSQPF